MSNVRQNAVRDDDFKLALAQWIEKCRAVTSPSEADYQLEHAFHLWFDGKQLGFTDASLVPLFGPGFEPIVAIFDADGTGPTVYAGFLDAYRAFVSGAVMTSSPTDTVQ